MIGWIYSNTEEKELGKRKNSWVNFVTLTKHGVNISVCFSFFQQSTVKRVNVKSECITWLVKYKLNK